MGKFLEMRSLENYIYSCITRPPYGILSKNLTDDELLMELRVRVRDIIYTINCDELLELIDDWHSWMFITKPSYLPQSCDIHSILQVVIEDYMVSELYHRLRQ